MVKNIQISIQSGLLAAVDRTTDRVGVTRSALIARALENYLRSLETRLLERRHAEGYGKKPVRRGEFDDWEKEQVWPGI